MPRPVRLPGARLPTWSSAHGGLWVRDVLILDAERRPTSAALVGLGMLVVVAFVLAFVLGSQAPRASGGAAPRPAAAATTATTGAGPALTPLRLDPVPPLPDLGEAAGRTRSTRPARAAASPLPVPAATAEPTPTPTPTPAAPEAVQLPDVPTRPAPTATPKPSPTPTEEPFDSSG
jgi:hypothetical protein